MGTRFEPNNIFEEIKDKCLSLELFENLVQSSSLYYQQQGSLDMLKLFIPNSNENSNLLNKWNQEKADLAAEQTIQVFTKNRIVNAYIKDIQEDGIYLAFKMETPKFLSMAEYIGEASYILSVARNNGVNLTADTWLKDFPYEFHSSWYNRKAASEEISVWSQDEDYPLFKEALYDGYQNWLENYKYPKIDLWEPKGRFTEVFKWADSEEENQKLIKDFRNTYNN